MIINLTFRMLVMSPWIEIRSKRIKPSIKFLVGWKAQLKLCSLIASNLLHNLTLIWYFQIKCLSSELQWSETSWDISILKIQDAAIAPFICCDDIFCFSHLHSNHLIIANHIRRMQNDLLSGWMRGHGLHMCARMNEHSFKISLERF